MPVTFMALMELYYIKRNISKTPCTMKNAVNFKNDSKKINKELRILNVEEMSKIRGGGKIPPPPPELE